MTMTAESNHLMSSLHPAMNEQDIILIVDDVPDNLALLHTVLEQANYRVLVATDGQSALERVAKFSPDAILMDAIMPGMDGFETCRLLKANPLTEHTPVIFMTGLTDTEHVVHGFEAGGIDYVTKPIKPSEVLARLGTHIRNARLANQNRQVIDAAKVAMLAVTPHGQLRWQTHAAANLLTGFNWQQHSPQNSTDTASLMVSIQTWLMQANDHALMLEWQQQRLSFSKLGQAHDGTQFILLKQLESQEQTLESRLAHIVQNCGLTQREAEVMHWVTLGKTNRDIGEILELSPRTVNKHLEHIFSKLGVETRTAAVAMVSHQLKT